MLNHIYVTTVTLEYRREKYNKNYGMDQSSVRVKMENQTSHRKVLLYKKKRLLNNVTEEPNLQTKQRGIQVLDFCLNVSGRYSEE